MGKKERASAAVVGFDVGKSSHRACAVAPDGAALFNREVANRPGEIDRALADAGPGARVVVDQKRNIGALVVARRQGRGQPGVLPAGDRHEEGPRHVPGDGEDRRDRRRGHRPHGDGDALDVARGRRGGARHDRAQDASLAARLRGALAHQGGQQAARGAPRGGPRLRGRRRPVEPLATRRPR